MFRYKWSNEKKEDDHLFKRFMKQNMKQSSILIQKFPYWMLLELKKCTAERISLT